MHSTDAAVRSARNTETQRCVPATQHAQCDADSVCVVSMMRRAHPGLYLCVVIVSRREENCLDRDAVARATLARSDRLDCLIRKQNRACPWRVSRAWLRLPIRPCSVLAAPLIFFTQGPGPAALVREMPDSPLKTQLEACVNMPNMDYQPSAFSIGHRGACMQFPEHTVNAYRL